jgi:predicted Zn-dependent protease
MFKKTITLIVLISLWLIYGCATNPVTGKRDLMLLSEEQEIAMGQQSDPEIIATFGLYEDQELQQFIERKGQEMAQISHRPDLPYEFKIVDTDVVNAFAVPGGFIYFTRGIMAHFNNEAEFAGVLGHEIGHVTARHSAKQYSKAQFANIGLGVGMIFSDTFRQFADVAGQGVQILFLKFGRDAERESDELGVEYSTKIGYDSFEMAKFFETLERLSGDNGDAIPSFLSTHPDPSERTENVFKETQKWQNKLNVTDPEVNRNSYLRMIDGIIYGKDPRQGYVENNIFYHPELKFSYNIPQNWAIQNSPQQVQMAPSDGDALMVLTLAPGNDLKTAAQQAMEKYKLEVTNSQETTVNGFPTVVIKAQQADEQGNVIEALFYFIQDGERIYMMYGVTTAAKFAGYSSLFTNTMSSFKRLTDPTFINRQPTRVQIREVKSAGTLRSALTSFNVNNDDLEELAMLNGMNLEDQVSAGMLIKTLSSQ